VEFDPAHIDPQLTYKLMASVIVPRPIGFTSTIDADGRPNLAPFSFFMMITSSPPHVAISVGARDGHEKDTLRNLRDTGEFVINTVSAGIGPQMAITASDWPPSTSEFDASGLTPVASEVVRPPRVAESPAHLECVTRQIFPVGGPPYGAHLIIGEVVRIHVRDDLLLDNNRVDLQRLEALGRLTGDWYCSTAEQYELQRPHIPSPPETSVRAGCPPGGLSRPAQRA
jgi:flavin reductase (DIM6/NTAB) family NADH-FMN oxidoreductase RutF